MSNIMDVNFNGTTAEMLKIISDYDEVSGFAGAYNIREDSKCAGRRSSENITIESKEDKPGINIRVKPFTVGETVLDRKSTRLNSSHYQQSRMPSSA